MLFEEKTQDVTVTVSAISGTFPVGTVMEVVPVEAGDYADAVGEAVDGKVNRMVAVDIIFRDAEGNEIEPEKPVSVKMQSALIQEEEAPVVVHVDAQGSASVVEGTKEYSEDELVFHAGEFSVYIIVGTETITTSFLSSDGNTYEVTVTYGQDAGIPVGSRLEVSELTEVNEEYNNYVERSASAIDVETDGLTYIKLLDIKIVDEFGEKVELNAPVDVDIRLMDWESNNTFTQIVHFAETNETEVINPSIEEDTVSFMTSGFSVYSIVSSGSTTGLNGKTFVIVNTFTNNAIQGSTQNDGTRLTAESVSFHDQGYISTNNDLETWTFFRNAGNGRYYIRNSQGNYLRINGNNDNGSVTVSTSSQALIVTAGTGNHTGQVRITNNNEIAINNYGGSTTGGFGTYHDNGNNEWFTLYEVENVVLNPAFSAEKIGVSSDDFNDAARIIIYKSVFNENTGSYEDYVIDGQGNLVKAYDKGDQVVGRSAVSPVWVVTFLRNSNGDLTGYYIFQNEETGLILHPLADGTLVKEYDPETSQTTDGVALKGREAGEYTSTIEYWDGSAMAWYGYEIVADANSDFKLQSGTGNNSQKLSFAKYISETTAELHPVNTISTAGTGITIKMFDYPDRQTITNVVGGDDYWAGNYYNNSGLASMRLAANGYPAFGSNNASSLFSEDSGYYKGTGDNLFLESVYDSTGYDEYNAFNN